MPWGHSAPPRRGRRAPWSGAAGSLVLGAALGLGVALAPLAASAQEAGRAQTLADIRAELAELAAEVQRLRAELAPGAGPTPQEPADSVLDRVERLERTVQNLTARTEELQFRIEGVVADGTNRLADIEFRLIELEGGDPAAAPPPSPLGGAAPAPAPPAPPAATEEGPLLAVGEQAAFDEAAAIHARGDWAAAEAALGEFTEAYPVGPLTPRAHLKRADALSRMDEPARAARAWLAAFNADRDGPQAPAALLGLGSALAALDQVDEACIMLDELSMRFGTSPEAAEAADARAEIGCP